MQNPGKTIEDIVKSHLKDIKISKKARKLLIENLIKEIVDWVNERQESKIVMSKRAIVMTPGAAHGVDKIIDNQGRMGKQERPTTIE